MPRIDSFLSLVVDQNASDLHFHAGTLPIIRYLGDLVHVPFRPLSETETKNFLFEIMTPDQRAQFERQQSVDFSYASPGVGRFRVNVFQQSRGMGAVFRVIADRTATIDELRLPPIVAELAHMGSGLVLVTGPTGSGKTTTLAAMVHEINQTTARHIITIEDPIEYIHKPAKAVVTQRELGTHTISAGAALRAALREAPDVIVVGELRDFETVSLALSAAETGTLVFGTLHTNSAAKAVDRLLSTCPEEALQQVSSTVAALMRGVIAQRLCKLASGDGRIAVIEVLLQSYAVSHLIREGKTFQIDGYLQSGEHSGSGERSLERSILEYIIEGVITAEEGLDTANDRAALQELIEKSDAARRWVGSG